MNISKSIKLFERAQESIPGGVNSPVRAFKSVGGNPIFIEKAKGAHLYDVDGNKYIDFIGSWGPMLLGHAFPPVVKALQQYAKRSTSFGAPTELEIKMAELICEIAPNVDLIRMVNSGTEACMSAVRLARGFTGRNKIIKFAGHYHGHADSFLVKAGSGVATFKIQNVPGVTSAVAEDTLVANFNDLQTVTDQVNNHPGQIAAIILEPVAGNMGCVLPSTGFLEGLRSICDEQGIILILDEVMTGFRLANGGAQERLNISADLVTYGKIIGGGLPVGAFGGKRQIMEKIAPLGNVYQAGTLSGNPLAMIAGFTTLQYLKDHPEVYLSVEAKTIYLSQGLQHILNDTGIPYVINQMGSMMSLHFTDQQVLDFNSASACDFQLFNRLFHHLLNHGIYLPPSPYETWFLSDALSYKDLDKTLKAFKKFFKQGKKAR